jgi:tetratricopeptide (TPR) repeat protein
MNLRPQINRAASVLLVAVLSLCSHFSAAQVSAAQARKDSPPDSGKKQDFLAQARAQFALGDLQAAEISLWNVLNTNPDQEQALLLLATIRGRQQRYPEAEALFRRVLQLNANSALAHRGLGGAFVAQNQPDKAIEHYQAAIDLTPEDLGLKVETAHLYAGRGQFEQALSLLQAIPQNRFPVEAIPVKMAVLLALGKDSDVATLAEQAKVSSSAEIELAEVFLDAKFPDLAQRCLDFAAAGLKRRPARFYYLQGRVFQSKNQPEAALRAFKQALAEDPKSTATLVAIAELHAAQNQHSDAVAALQKALALSPDSVIVLRHLVVEATKAGNGQVALDAAAELEARSPDNPDDLYLAGAAMLQQNSPAASTALEKYVALRTDNAKAWFGLGMAYVQQKRYTDARHPLERSVQLDPTIAEAEYQLGVVAKNESNPTEAMQHFQRAVTLQPQHAKALWSLGNLYLLSGDLQKAQENLQAAEAIDPNNLETEYDLGLVLSKLGKPEMAKPHFERFQKLKDAQPPAPRDAR